MVRSGLAIPRLLAFGALASIALLSACGGGGSSSAPSAGAGPNAPGPTASTAAAFPSAGKAPASFKVTIPSVATATANGVARKTASISASTNGIVISLLKTDNTTAGSLTGTFDVSSTSSLCTTDANGNRTCTLQISAPIGTDIFTVDTYTNKDGTGSKLGSGAVRLTVAENVANSASVTIGGALTSVLAYVPPTTYYGSIYLDAPGGPFGYPTSARLYVFGFDASGNPIVVPDTYSTPISISLFVGYNYNYLTNLGSTARRPLGATTDPANFLTASVQYAFPSGGATMASTALGTSTVVTTSPNDIVTLTGVPFGPSPYGQSLTVVSSVGALPPSPSPTPSASPGTLSATSALVVTVYPPTPAPTTAPATPATLTWFSPGSDPRFKSSGGVNTLNFTSPYDAPITMSLADSVAGYSGAITLTSTCTFSSTTNDFSSDLPASLASSPYSFTLTPAQSGVSAFQPSPNPSPLPTQIAPCTITATDANSPAATTILTINMNATTGTIQ